MLDANQQWTMPVARAMCGELAKVRPLWIEEPTHPDDLTGHAALAREIAPIKIATGEHLPNRVVFKNFIGAGAMHFVQADCTRLAGVSEFLAVSLLARKAGLPVVPHVGDMGQIHQHLVLFNHVAMGHRGIFSGAYSAPATALRVSGTSGGWILSHPAGAGGVHRIEAMEVARTR